MLNPTQSKYIPDYNGSEARIAIASGTALCAIAPNGWAQSAIVGAETFETSCSRRKLRVT